MSRWPDVVKWKAWRRRLRAFDRGQATVEEFCWREGVSIAAFYQWRRKLAAAVDTSTATSRDRKTTLRQTAPQSGFVPVEITGWDAPPSTSRAQIEVLLPGGPKLLIPCGEEQAIRTVIAALTDAFAATPTKPSPERREC